MNREPEAEPGRIDGSKRNTEAGEIAPTTGAAERDQPLITAAIEEAEANKDPGVAEGEAKTPAGTTS